MDNLSADPTIAWNRLLFILGIGYILVTSFGFVLSLLAGFSPPWYEHFLSVFFYPLAIIGGVIGNSLLILFIFAIYFTAPEIVLVYLLFRRKSREFATVLGGLTLLTAVADLIALLLVMILSSSS